MRSKIPTFDSWSQVISPSEPAAFAASHQTYSRPKTWDEIIIGDIRDHGNRPQLQAVDPKRNSFTLNRVPRGYIIIWKRREKLRVIEKPNPNFMLNSIRSERANESGDDGEKG